MSQAAPKKTPPPKGLATLLLRTTVVRQDGLQRQAAQPWERFCWEYMLAAATQEAEGAWKVAKTSLTSFLKGARSKIVGPALSPPRPWVFRKQNIMGKIVTETRYNNKTVL